MNLTSLGSVLALLVIVAALVLSLVGQLSLPVALLLALLGLARLT